MTYYLDWNERLQAWWCLIKHKGNSGDRNRTHYDNRIEFARLISKERKESYKILPDEIRMTLDQALDHIKAGKETRALMYAKVALVEAGVWNGEIKLDEDD